MGMGQEGEKRKKANSSNCQSSWQKAERDAPGQKLLHSTGDTAAAATLGLGDREPWAARGDSAEPSAGP